MKVYIKSKQMIPEEMRADLELRWNRLRNYMRENEMDACLDGCLPVGEWREYLLYDREDV